MKNLADFTHSLENLLDQMRSLELRATDEVIGTLLQSIDVLRNLLDVDLNANSESAPPADAVEVAARITALLQGEPAPEAPAFDDSQQLGSLGQEPARPVKFAQEINLYKVDFHPDRELFASGTNPITLLRNLAALGTVSCCHLHTGELPALADLNPSQCYPELDGRVGEFIPDRGPARSL